ncbi:hypothetical protein LOC67_05645 [Stieleria sp. JC731]|uniref:hypothetical protein n=1 Tax=Pirellulaceae TaxID=2691357 RepID=UPI001E4C186A|nr:hypothetical protein [Stieleria sp. JC731]MCC9600037.1 hypothetical protein [Stieleria sp. JC731]
MSNAFEPQFTGTIYDDEIKQNRKSKGCLIGCLAAAGACVLMIACAGFGVYKFASGAINTYTSTEPMELESVEYSEEQMAELNERVETFREKLNAGETPDEELVLTADDINAWISDDERLRDRIFVRIEDDQVKGDVSMPLDWMPLGEGRFFNGSGTFDVSMEGGVLIVTMQEATVNGEPVPEPVMEGFRKENLAKDMYEKQENAEFMRKFEDIRIEDGKFILRVKRTEADSTQETSESEELPTEDLPAGSTPTADDTEAAPPAPTESAPVESTPAEAA